VFENLWWPGTDLNRRRQPYSDSGGIFIRIEISTVVGAGRLVEIAGSIWPCRMTGQQASRCYEYASLTCDVFEKSPEQRDAPGFQNEFSDAVWITKTLL
jgi:hypothetical protein